MKRSHTAFAHALFFLLALFCPALHAQDQTQDLGKVQQQANLAFEAYQNSITYQDANEQLETADSLYAVGEKQGNSTVKIYALILRSTAYYSNGDKEAMQKALDEWKLIAKSNNNQHSYYEALRTEGQSLTLFNVAEGIEAANNMIKQAVEDKFPHGQIKGYQLLGDIYYSRGNTKTSIKKYQKALKLYYSNKGEEENPEYIFLATAWAYYDQKIYDKATIFSDSAYHYVDFAPDIKVEIEVMRALIAVGQKADDSTFFSLYDQAVSNPNYEESMDPDTRTQLRIYWLIRKNQAREALALTQEIAMDVNRVALQKECYEALGDFQNAMLKADKLSELMDSLQDAIQTDELSLMDAQIGNVELAREAAEKDAEAAKQRAKAQLIMFVGIFSVLLVIMVSGIFILIRRRKHLKVLQAKNQELQVARDQALDARDEAEEQRREAVSQRAEAERQRQEADRQRDEADRHRMEAEKQRAEADRQRDEADRQRDEANHHRMEAENQRNIAEVARHQAEQANEMKGHFIENMMHEIRTPLNAISGFSMLLTDPMAAEDPGSMKEASDMISKNTQHLVHLLDDIIQISNYESLSVEIEMLDTSISEVVLTTVMNAPQALDGVEIVPEIDNLADDPMMFTNQDMLLRALGCMMNNAVKFTKQGTISLGAEFDDQKVTFWIQDNGPGIPEGEEENIFERFVKLDNFIPGTGLGLSLCRAIVTALNGEVRLDRSSQLPGSRFILTLDRQLALLGTGTHKEFTMEAMPAQSAMISEEDLEELLQQMRADNPDLTREELLQMLG